MKNKDLKKGKESAIDKNIYGFLLFMPLIAIGVTCLYAIFNKNANQSNNTNIVYKDTVKTNLITDDTYYVFVNDTTTNTNTYVYGYDFYVLETTNNNIDFTNARSFLVDANYLILRDDTNTIIGQYSNITISFNFKLTSVAASTNITSIKEKVEINESLKDVFYYAIDKVEESNLFNWSKTTIIYTGIANTCTQLGITNTFTPMLLAYWLLISVIYILYDIVLMILIILHNRVHRLQDSMS